MDVVFYKIDFSHNETPLSEIFLIIAHKWEERVKHRYKVCKIEKTPGKNRIYLLYAQ